MSSSQLLARSKIAAVIGATTIALLVPGAGAYADTQPPSGTPATVSTDALPTVQINGVVWSQVVVGDTVYAAGSFTKARPAGAAAGTRETDRLNFVAYNIKTGALLTTFAPSFDAQVRALALSPDKSTLYAGGQFKKVNGVARSYVAAFDLNHAGALISGFAPALNSSVYGITATASSVYVVGIFTAVGSSTRKNAVALGPTDGKVQPFQVTPNGGIIRQVAVKSDGTKVVLGGGFTSMNGSSQAYGLAMAKGSSGDLINMSINSVVHDGGTDSAIMNLTATSGGFYGSGYRHGNTTGNFEGAFRADWNGTVQWLDDCHGDTYSVAPTTDVVYVAGHPHDCSDIGGFPDTANPVAYHRALAFTAAANRTVTGRVSGYHDFRGQPAPTLLHWFPDINVGTYTGQSQGPWNVVASGDFVVYGGEFTTVDGKSQQGLVRFARSNVAPNVDGPRVSGSGFNLTARSAGSGTRRVTVSWTADWDRDNANLTYTLTRDGATVATSSQSSTFWNRPAMQFSDGNLTAGHSYTYQVTASDPYHNAKASDTASVTAR